MSHLPCDRRTTAPRLGGSAPRPPFGGVPLSRRRAARRTVCRPSLAQLAMPGAADCGNDPGGDEKRHREIVRNCEALPRSVPWALLGLGDRRRTGAAML